jgi:hypothetical protein
MSAWLRQHALRWPAVHLGCVKGVDAGVERSPQGLRLLVVDSRHISFPVCHMPITIGDMRISVVPIWRLGSMLSSTSY